MLGYGVMGQFILGYQPYIVGGPQVYQITIQFYN